MKEMGVLVHKEDIRREMEKWQPPLQWSLGKPMDKGPGRQQSGGRKIEYGLTTKQQQQQMRKEEQLSGSSGKEGESTELRPHGV